MMLITFCRYDFPCQKLHDAKVKKDLLQHAKIDVLAFMQSHFEDDVLTNTVKLQSKLQVQ